MAWLCVALLALIAAILWMVTRVPEEAPAARPGPADPFLDEVRRFRRDVADYDGSGGRG